MKRFLIASLLLLSSAAYARITQAPNVSVTAAADDADSVAKQNSYIYGIDSAGDNRRVQVNTSGQVVTVGGGGSAATAVTLTSVAVGVSITVNNTDASAVPVRVTGQTSVKITDATGAAFSSSNPLPVVVTNTASAEVVSTLGSLTWTAATLNTILGVVTSGAQVIPTGFIPLTSVALISITTNATTIVNLTSTAAYSGTMPLLYTITLISGANYLSTVIFNGDTAPASFTNAIGDFVYPNTIKVADIELDPAGGPHLFIRANTLSATSATGYLHIYRRKGN